MKLKILNVSEKSPQMNIYNLHRMLYLLPLIICFSISCNEKKINTEEDVKKVLQQKSEEFSKAYMNKNFDKIVEAYTKEGLVIANRKGFIQGHENLLEYWKEPDHSIIKEHKIYPANILLNGDYAHDYGYYRLSGIYDGKEWGPSNGTYLIIWKKVKGDWKIHIDMFHEYEGQIPDSLKINNR